MNYIFIGAKHYVLDFSLSFFLSLCLCLFFKPRISLCSPGCPGTYTVDQTGIELKRSACFYFPSAETKGVHHHARLKF